MDKREINLQFKTRRQSKPSDELQQLFRTNGSGRDFVHIAGVNAEALVLVIVVLDRLPATGIVSQIDLSVG